MDEQDLSARTAAALLARGWTICAAESCTGGMVTAWLTQVPGSSAYVLGGVVSYANEVKRDLLGVPQQVLDEHGAVSEQTARLMALGARKLFGADLALSVTGIAGPGGSTADKPVGLTYIGLAGPGEDVLVRRFVWEGDRTRNRIQSTEAALSMVLEAAG